MTTSYWSGRQPTVLLAAAALYAVISIGLWRHQFVTEPVAGGVLRAFPAMELAAILCAPVAAHGLTSRMPALDLTSPRPLRRRAIAAATSLMGAFAAVPLLILAAVNLVPELLPPGTFADVSTEDRPLDAIYTPTMALSIAMGVALLCALALLAVGLVGSVAGPVLYLALAGAIVMAQGTTSGSVIALSGAGDPPYEIHLWGALLAAAACSTATLVWSRTRAAAAPLSARLRHSRWLSTGIPSSAPTRASANN
ncbi:MULTISPECIES: hypothetical protein [Micrococcales]|uniref:hypothetical protein n=1 Tax=Micrococcales TaxID=85006 RepID=UPI0005B8B3CD|nr:hypothetical protein [Cellulosimicrobium cellulans]